MCQSCDVWEALRRLDFVRRRALRPRLLALGLTLGEGQPRILNRLLRRGVPMTQRELADACWLDTATLSRTLDRMEAAGLLRRMPDGESRRSYRIVLTEAGREKPRRCAPLLKRPTHACCAASPPPNPPRSRTACGAPPKILRTAPYKSGDASRPRF